MMKTVEYNLENRIAYITLNRPDKRNALNDVMVSELTELFDQIEQDELAKVVVLKANGDAFCAGADLAYLQQLQSNTYEQNLEDSNNLKTLFEKIYTSSKVVIAMVQGHAIAGGCGLATVCDFSFTVPQAKFGYTEVRIGFIPAIVKVFLLRKIGEGRAKSLLLSGRLIDANEALAMGLISGVCRTAEELEARVNELASELVSSNSAQSMALTKQMIAAVQSMEIHEALKYAAEQNAHARETEDCKRGIAAFLNKEKIMW